MSDMCGNCENTTSAIFFDSFYQFFMVSPGISTTAADKKFSELEYVVSVFKILKIRSSHPTTSMLSQEMPYFADF